MLSTNEPGPVRPFDNGNAAQFSMSGAPSQANELLLNGAPDGTWDKRVAYSPPQDAVMEVRVQSFESDAAYGHTAGGTVNVNQGRHQFPARLGVRIQPGLTARSERILH